MLKSEKYRIHHLDFIRSMAILMVILVHTTENIYSFHLSGMQSLTPLSEFFAFSCFTLGRLGVPFFLFLSGYLLLDQKYTTITDVLTFWKRKLLPLLFLFECWTIIYELFCTFFKDIPFNLTLCIKRMLFLEASPLYHMWYMPMIIGIYLTLPFVSFVIRQFPIKVLLIPMTVAFFYCFIIPGLNVLSAALKLPVFTPRLSLSYTGDYYGLYLVSGFLIKKSTEVFRKNFSKNVKTPCIILFILFTALFLATIFFQIWCYKNNYSYNVWYSFPFLFLCAIAAFWLCECLKASIPHMVLFREISRASLGMYFIHPILLSIFSKYHFFFLNNPGKPFKVTLVFLICAFLSFVLVEILLRIPLLSKLFCTR